MNRGLARDYSTIVEQMIARHAIRVRRWRKSMSGCAWRVYHANGTTENFIEAPFPKTPISLAVFLHEVGHHVIGFHAYKKRCEEEYHVWMWSLQAMRELGIHPDPRVMRRVTLSIRYAVDKAMRRGIRELPEPLMQYLPRAA